MKRVLVAGALSGLLLLGAPTLASSAPKGGSDNKSSDSKNSDNKSANSKAGGKSSDSKSGGQKNADGNKGGDRKGGDHKGGDHKGGGKDRDHRDGYRDGDRNRHYNGRYGHGRYGYGRYGNRYGYGYGGGYYGEPYDCYRDSSGYTTCEEYGGDWDPWGYNYRGPRQGSVLVREMGFNPQQVNVRPGQQVIWVFDDRDVPHTVTANNGSFDSGQKVSDEFRLRFDQPGTYSYHCALHPEMQGRVVVHG